MEKPYWDGQFAETTYEMNERWRKTRAKRIAEGKCWQCANPVETCACPNVTHNRPVTPQGQ